MVRKRHMNLKEMLLGDAAADKCMIGVVEADYAKKTKKKKCTCRASRRPDDECLYGEECETQASIYKIICKCCNSHYIGKTQRSVKKRCIEHYQGVGRILQEYKKFNASLNAELSPPPAPKSSIYLRYQGICGPIVKRGISLQKMKCTLEYAANGK